MGLESKKTLPYNTRPGGRLWDGMKLHILSDLHLEFPKAKHHIPHVNADILVLAGDIHVGTKAISWLTALKINDRYDKVIYIPGNHEYYHQTVSQVDQGLLDRTLERSSNIYCANPGILYYDDVKISYCTLWTDFEGGSIQSMQACRRGMSDFHVINNGKFDPKDAAKIFSHHKTFLEESITHGKEYRKQVVITHHLPSHRSVNPFFAGSSINGGFVSDVEDLMEDVDLWVHGHTHSSFDYNVGDCRVVCNPRGYPHSPNYDFNPNLVIEI